MKNILPFCLGALVFAASALPADTDSDRMLALAKVWATVEFFHPYLGYQGIDWDAAVIRAAPSIRAAHTKDELSDALAQLLGALGDPVTQVVQPRQPTDYLAMITQGVVDARLEDGVVILTVVDYPSAADLDKHLDKLAHARAVVFDLREYRNLRFSPSLLDGSRMSHMLSTTPLLGPGYRRRTTVLASGYPVNSLTIEGGATIRPDPHARDIPAVFVLGSETVPPSFALAMHAAGKGFIVCEGASREDAMVDVQRFTFAGEVDVRWPLILRPAAIYGPGRGVQESLQRGACRVDDNFVSRIHVDDLAAHVEAGLLSEVTGAYPVADEEPCTSQEIAEFCAKLLDWPLPLHARANEIRCGTHSTRSPGAVSSDSSG